MDLAVAPPGRVEALAAEHVERPAGGRLVRGEYGVDLVAIPLDDRPGRPLGTVSCGPGVMVRVQPPNRRRRAGSRPLRVGLRRVEVVEETLLPLLGTLRADGIAQQ